MAIKKKTDDKKERTVYIPRQHKHDDSLFVAVNGERILVRKGESVSLPAKFAEAVENSFLAARKAEKFISDMAED